MLAQRNWCVALILGLVVTPSGAVATRGVVVSSSPNSGSAHLQVFGIRPAAVASLAAAKLDGSLAEISGRYPTLPTDHQVARLHAMNPAARFRLSAPLATPEVLIDSITLGDPQALKSALQNLGLENAAVFSNDVGGWLPVNRIAAAAALTELHFARASMPRTRAPVATQGDFAIRSSVIRTNYPNLTGAGVTVGVLSDSFNCYQTYADDASVPVSGANGYASNGFTATYATDQSTGALPAGVNVLEEAPCLDYGAPEQLPFGDEGRAIMQIVHVIAPDAKLAFYTAVNSEADFANGIVALAQAGAKIIDDDVGYPDEPFFQDGEVAQAVDQVAAQGVAYFSAAGNDAEQSYENTAPVFSTASGSEKLLNFDTTGATNATTLPVTIPSLIPGEFVFVIVEWDQPYVTGAPQSGGATGSLDLCVNASGADQLLTYTTGAAATCTGANATGVDPVQIMILGNPASATSSTPAENVTLTIGFAGGTPPGRVKLLVDTDGAAATFTSFATNSATIQGHPGAAGAAAVGAAFYFQTPQCGTSPAVLETFSSAGGDPILFTSAGAAQTPVVRQKPDFVGPDGLNNTFIGFTLASDGFPDGGTLNTTITECQNNPAYPNFFGTSAAAPHAAAAAALMMQANPAVTATEILAAYRKSALAMSASAPDYENGYGFVQADAALALLPPGAPTISVSPTSVAVGSSATLTWSSVGTTGCTASGSWTGAEAASGTMTVTPSASGSDTYTLTCTGAAGASPANSATLTVNAASTGSGGGGGGGGSLDEISLLALCGVFLMRSRLWALRRAAKESRTAS